MSKRLLCPGADNKHGPVHLQANASRVSSVCLCAVQESLDWRETGLWTLSGRAGVCPERVRRTRGGVAGKVWVLYKKVWIGVKPDCGPWSVSRKGKKNHSGRVLKVLL